MRLPLPQDVGDALLRYLDCRPANIATDYVFLRSIAPCRPFASGDGVSSKVVKHALKRANIDTLLPEAHTLLRHTAATEMLPEMAFPWIEAGLVLRHRHHRHDSLLRQGECGAAQTGGPAVAGGEKDDCSCRILCSRRAAGRRESFHSQQHRISPAQLLAGFAIELKQAHVCTATAIDWASQAEIGRATTHALPDHLPLCSVPSRRRPPPRIAAGGPFLLIG